MQTASAHAIRTGLEIYPLPNKSVRVRSCGSSFQSEPWLRRTTFALFRSVSRSRWPVPSEPARTWPEPPSELVRVSTPRPQAQHRARPLEYSKISPKSTKDRLVDAVDRAEKPARPPPFPTRRRNGMNPQSAVSCLSAPVAQLDRANASGALGREFESLRAHQPSPAQSGFGWAGHFNGDGCRAEASAKADFTIPVTPRNHSFDMLR